MEICIIIIILCTSSVNSNYYDSLCMYLEIIVMFDLYIR